MQDSLHDRAEGAVGAGKTAGPEPEHLLQVPLDERV
jgi:hypothetical protein